MKNRIFSLAISVVILLFYFNAASFAQNQPEKKDTKTKNQTTQVNYQKDNKTNQNQVAKTTNNQKDVKMNENKMTSDNNTKQATVTKDKKNNEQVNTQYHKKQGTTDNEKQKQDKAPVKGDSNKQVK